MNRNKFLIACLAAFVSAFCAVNPASATVAFSSSGTGGPVAPVLTGSSLIRTSAPCTGATASAPDTVTLGGQSGSYTGEGTYQINTLSFCISRSNATPNTDNLISISEDFTINGITASLNVLATLTVTTMADYLTITGGSTTITDTQNSLQYLVEVQPFALSACTPVSVRGSGDATKCIGYTGDDNHDPHGYMVGLSLFATISDSPLMGGDNFSFAQDEPPPEDTPEPSTLALLGMGLTGVSVLRRRARRALTA